MEQGGKFQRMSTVSKCLTDYIHAFTEQQIPNILIMKAKETSLKKQVIKQQQKVITGS